MLRIRVQSQKGKVASCFMLTSEVAQGYWLLGQLPRRVYAVSHKKPETQTQAKSKTKTVSSPPTNLESKPANLKPQAPTTTPNPTLRT